MIYIYICVNSNIFIHLLIIYLLLSIYVLVVVIYSLFNHYVSIIELKYVYLLFLISIVISLSVRCNHVVANQRVTSDDLVNLWNGPYTLGLYSFVRHRPSADRKARIQRRWWQGQGCERILRSQLSPRALAKAARHPICRMTKENQWPLHGTCNLSPHGFKKVSQKSKCWKSAKSKLKC